MTEHVSEERLILLADEPRSDVDAEAHAASCAECSKTLDFFRMLSAEMKDRESWRIEEEVRTRRGGRAVAEFAARIAAEDAAAPPLLAELRERLARDPDAAIADDPRFRNGGVVRALEQLVLDLRNADPFLADRLAHVGCVLAEALPDDEYPANAVFDLRGRAWVLHAGTCTFIDRYDEAFEDADRAERAYSRLADPAPGLAAVKLTRAILYIALRRLSEGIPLAKSAVEEYEWRGDWQKYGVAIGVLASLYYAADENDAALELYSRVLEIAEEVHDAELQTSALHNLGLLSRKRGDLEAAAKYLLEALSMAEGLGMKTTAAHSRWSIGILALARGEFVDAERILRGAIRDLHALGYEWVATEAKLDLAEALLVLGRPQEIERLCAEVEAYYTKRGAISGRFDVARFLRNAAANQMLRNEDIQHVRKYLDESREKPETPFAPPRRDGSGSGH